MKEVFILIYLACLCHIISTQSDVRLPPTVTSWSRENRYIWCSSGNSLILGCDAKGTPAVKYEWKKNGFELNTSLSNIRKGSDCTITINDMTEMDEGNYQCFAKNQYGTALSDMTHVRMRSSESIAGPPTVFQKTVVEGKPFHIHGHRPRSSPKLWYKWYTATELNARSTLVESSERIQDAYNGDLHFAYALQEDASDGRIYRCKYSHNDSPCETTTQLTVTRNPTGNISQFAPTLAFSDAERYVDPDGNIIYTLSCFFYGYPVPMISWSGPSNPTRKYELYNFNTTRYIDPEDASDEGNYSCTASNSQGDNTYTFQIRFEAVPNFTNTEDGPYNVNVTEGQSFSFNCNAFAIPEANIVWFQNGQPIDTDNPPERFVFSNDLKSLTIRDVCRDCVDRESKTDLMVIQCNASNIHGYAFAQGYLNVLMKTKVTISGSKSVSVDFRQEKQFVFLCHVVSDPSRPATVLWYKTEPFDDLVRDEPPYVYVTKNLLIIIIDPKCSADCSKYLGEYRCIGDDGYIQENRSITLSYKYRPSPESDTKKEDLCAMWKIFLGVCGVGVVLLLIGIFVFFHSRRHLAIKRRTKGRNLPNPPSMYERVGYDSVDLPLQREEDSGVSMRKAYSMYEHVGYDSIDQVLKDMAEREGAAVHSADVDGYNGYESIDAPQKEAISTGRAMLDEDTMYDDTEHSVPLEEVTNNRKINQHQINGHESVQSKSGKFPKSNEQLESVNTYSDINREVVNPNLDLEKSDLNSKEANPCLDSSTTEVNQYMDLGPKEVNHYLELNPKEVNEYLDLDLKEVNEYLDLDHKEVNEYLDLYPKEVNQYLDLDPKELDQYMELGRKDLSQNMDMGPKDVNLYLNLGPKEMDS